nr:uncharacterized protein LOC128693375 [Cherax quadricarinatus]
MAVKSVECLAKKQWLKKHLLSFKTLSLVVLSVQTSTMVLLLRYSRTPTHSNHHPYIITTAVLLSEVLKLGLSLGFLHIESGKVMKKTMTRLYKDVVVNVWETLKLAVPAFLYVVQNNLLFIALTNLDAATYQVTYQLKILTTAIFSWVMLGKRLAPIHWLSLCLLMLGVSLVQVEGSTGEESTRKILPVPEVEVLEGADTVFLGGHKDGADLIPRDMHNKAHPNTEVSRLLGIFAVLVSCISSGFSGVYFERLVKRSSQTSLIIRNIQLEGIGDVVRSQTKEYELEEQTLCVMMEESASHQCSLADAELMDDSSVQSDAKQDKGQSTCVASASRATPDVASPSGQPTATKKCKRGDISMWPALVATLNVATPDVATPHVATPDVSIPHVATPDVSTPHVATPDVPSSAVANTSTAADEGASDIVSASVHNVSSATR